MFGCVEILQYRSAVDIVPGAYLYASYKPYDFLTTA